MSDKAGFMEKNVLAGSERALPKEITRRYRIVSCLKSTQQRCICLLANREEKRFLLKFQPAGRPDTLQKEYDILRELDCEGVPRAVSYLEEEGTEYLIRTYIEGESLQELVEREGAPGEERSIALLQSLCAVLASLHARKPPVIHRDIKPQNVIVTPEGACALIDFGTARHYREGGAADTVFMGTEATAPPEQFGYAQTDARTDIYAVGMLLFYMLTGTLTRTDGTCANGRRALTPLEKIAGKCTAFDPDRRFQSVRSLQRALTAARHRRKIAVVSVCAVLLALVTVLAGVFCQTKRAVHFENALLEQAVRKELDLGERQRIPAERLREVEQIILCGNQVWTDWDTHQERYYDLKNDSSLRTGRGAVADLSELTRLPNLEVLVLDYQNITDLSALEGMKLQYVSLCGNRIRDLSVFTEMETLRALWLEDNPLTALDALAGLPGLCELEIGGTNIDDAAPLVTLPLTTLLMHNTPVDDYSFLEKLAGLRVFTAGAVNAEQMRQIYGLTSLEQLSLSTELTDLEGFQNLGRLNTLDLSNSGMLSLQGVEKLPNLTYLGLGNTSPESLEPLCASETLEIVELVGAKVADYTPLCDCQKLHTVHVGFEQEEEAERQLAGSGLQIYAWE